MSQEAAMLTVEAPSPWPVPPLCTRPDTLWCADRFMRRGAPGPVCRAPKPCEDGRSRVKPPQPWSERDVERLSKNSHLELSTLQQLLDEYHTVDEIRAKLEEVDP